MLHCPITPGLTFHQLNVFLNHWKPKRVVCSKGYYAGSTDQSVTMQQQQDSISIVMKEGRIVE